MQPTTGRLQTDIIISEKAIAFSSKGYDIAAMLITPTVHMRLEN